MPIVLETSLTFLEMSLRKEHFNRFFYRGNAEQKLSSNATSDNLQVDVLFLICF